MFSRIIFYGKEIINYRKEKMIVPGEGINLSRLSPGRGPPVGQDPEMFSYCFKLYDIEFQPADLKLQGEEENEYQHGKSSRKTHHLKELVLFFTVVVPCCSGRVGMFLVIRVGMGYVRPVRKLVNVHVYRGVGKQPQYSRQ
jgi:hypothetical protein